jgi:apolipoprotein D and lipocalin family protein
MYLHPMLRKLLAAMAVGLIGTGCYGPLDTVPYVDTTQLEGTWFEIGHLPRSTQDGCAGTTATYTPTANGRLAVLHECTLPGGQQLKSQASLYVIDQTTHAKLGIDLGGFIGDYWIIDEAPDYRYVVVGHPSRQYMWILARDRHMTQEDLDTVLANAKNKGFDTSVVEYTNQDGGESPQSANSGCSAATTTKRVSGGATFGLVALGVIAILRRRRK